jgi:Cytochrome P450
MISLETIFLLLDFSPIMRLYHIMLPPPDLPELSNRSPDLTRLLPATSAAIYLLFVLLVLLSYKFITYPTFSCSVRHVPGPYISKVTGLWLTYQGYKNNANQYIHGLHKAYGPVVRVAPDLVSFNSVEAITAIYGVRSNFQKPPSAASMDNYRKPNTFSSVSNEDHRRRRGRYASSYSRSNMTQGNGYEGILHRTKQVLAVIHGAAVKGESVDIYKIFHCYAIDNTAVIASGTTMGLLDGHNIGYSQDLRDMFVGLAYVFYFSTLSMLLRIMPFVSAYFLPEPVLKAFHAHRRVQDKNIEHYLRSRSIQEPEFAKAVLVRLQEHKDYGSPDLTDMHVASEISDHLLAGMRNYRIDSITQCS